MNNPFSLQAKTIMITGASSGIGRQIAISAANQGATVILIGRNTERLRNTLASLKENDHSFYKCDITDEKALSNVVDTVPPLNGIVHSAGVLLIAPSRILSTQQMMLVNDTNYHAPVTLTRLLLNGKKLANGASIVFITSVNGPFTAVKGFGAYAGSKAALTSFAKVLALEYASKKIRCNSIAPGMIKTEMFKEMLRTVSAESVDNDKLKYPLGDYGEPEDVANAAIYLLSEASKWVTGTSIVVDGGLTIT